MNLTHLVDRLVEAIERNPELDDDALEGMLLDHGADVRTARELLLFVPIAWCRALFQHAGPTFPRTFGLFQNGAFAPERALADEPAFVEGLLAAKRCKKRDLFFSVAGRSADFNAINQALHGSETRDPLDPLVCDGG
jgi:hypothetical protein